MARVFGRPVHVGHRGVVVAQSWVAVDRVRTDQSLGREDRIAGRALGDGANVCCACKGKG